MAWAEKGTKLVLFVLLMLSIGFQCFGVPMDCYSVATHRDFINCNKKLIDEAEIPPKTKKICFYEYQRQGVIIIPRKFCYDMVISSVVKNDGFAKLRAIKKFIDDAPFDSNKKERRKSTKRNYRTKITN